MKHVVITIGREYGSGGRLIAKQLSEELGITFYDKELITAVARKTGFSENFIRDSEHQRPTNSFLHGIQSAGDVLFLRCLAGFDHENFHVIPPSCKSILRFLPG